MKGKYLRKVGGLALTALMLFGIAFVSSSEVQAQRPKYIFRAMTLGGKPRNMDS